MPAFIAHNYAMVTTAQPTPVTTSTSLKTMLQVATPSTLELEIIAWGFAVDGTAATTPISVELLDGDVAATGGTAHGATGVQKWDVPGGVASQVTLGTSATGFSFGTEGTITASRTLDEQQWPPTQPYAMWFPLGDRPRIAVSRFVRVRVKAGTAVNMTCWILWRE